MVVVLALFCALTGQSVLSIFACHPRARGRQRFSTSAPLRVRPDIAPCHRFSVRGSGASRNLTLVVCVVLGGPRASARLARARPRFGAFRVVDAQVSIDHLHLLGMRVFLWASMDLRVLPLWLRSPLSVLSACYGGALAVRGAMLDLPEEVLERVSGSAHAVMSAMAHSYRTQLLGGLGSVLIRSTLVDTLATPVMAGKQGLCAGLRALDFTLSWAACALEVCTLDHEYVQQKKEERLAEQGSVAGLVDGVQAAAWRVASGCRHLGDVVVHPVRCARLYGAQGLLEGLCRGALGTVLKLGIEAADGARALARGLELEVRESGGASRRRVVARRWPPRVTYVGGAIREYDEEAAGLVWALRAARPGAGCSEEDCGVVLRAASSIEGVLVVETRGVEALARRVVLLHGASLLILAEVGSTGALAVRWVLPVSALRFVRASSHGVVVHGELQVRQSAPASLVARQIPCRQELGRSRPLAGCCVLCSRSAPLGDNVKRRVIERSASEFGSSRASPTQLVVSRWPR